MVQLGTSTLARNQRIVRISRVENVAIAREQSRGSEPAVYVLPHVFVQQAAPCYHRRLDHGTRIFCAVEVENAIVSLYLWQGQAVQAGSCRSRGESPRRLATRRRVEF